MITVQTLSVQIQQYHVDFQHLVNLETEKPISNDDVVEMSFNHVQRCKR